MRSVGFDRDEPPRGERDRGDRERPPPDRGVKGFRFVREGLTPAGARHVTRLDAKRESPVQRQRRGRPVTSSFISQDVMRGVPHRQAGNPPRC